MESCTLSTGSLLKHGEYWIASVLGQGGFGITYEAEQVSLGRKVAIKEFFMKELCNRDASTSHVSVPSVGSKELVEKFRQKFIREARTIAALDHKHIVRIHDVFEENGTAYYVMEYLSGGSLDRKIRECGALSEEKAVDYIRQISDALQYIHSRSILHFDVKPSNVLLSENGIAKLIDFGISKHYDESGSQTSSTPVGISKGFAPLEQYQQGGDIKTFTPATDIYALGATLYALVVGNNPPEASVVGEDGLPAKPLNVSVNLWNAVERAMSFRRKDRPQSVGAFLNLLDGGKSGVPTIENATGEITIIKSQSAQDKSSKTSTNGSKLKTEGTNTGFPKWLYTIGTAVIAACTVFVVYRKPALRSDILDELGQNDSIVAVTETMDAQFDYLPPNKPAKAGDMDVDDDIERVTQIMSNNQHQRTTQQITNTANSAELLNIFEKYNKSISQGYCGLWSTMTKIDGVNKKSQGEGQIYSMAVTYEGVLYMNNQPIQNSFDEPQEWIIRMEGPSAGVYCIEIECSMLGTFEDDCINYLHNIGCKYLHGEESSDCWYKAYSFKNIFVCVYCQGGGNHGHTIGYFLAQDSHSLSEVEEYIKQYWY